MPHKVKLVVKDLNGALQPMNLFIDGQEIQATDMKWGFEQWGDLLRLNIGLVTSDFELEKQGEELA